MKERIPLILGSINYILIFLFPKYLILGIIIFISSLIFVWAFKTKIIEKIIFSLFPLFFFMFPPIDLPYSIKEIQRFRNSQKIDFVFPENFTGNAIIVTEKDCGQNVIIKNGYVKLYIPENGILYYKGIIKDYGRNYYFRYYRITNKDTIEIPAKYFGSSLNPIESDFKVAYGDATINKNKNLSKILLNFYSPKNIPDYNSELLEKNYNCK